MCVYRISSVVYIVAFIAVGVILVGLVWWWLLINLQAFRKESICFRWVLP